ncbi:YcnI family protein [Microbacterium sp. STN6]|uniref:YcnI family copper-binding membrane protein n=1 Tax=Microbacterium sp. STN6 TaxID=2995588 RepID=UPI002260E84C|nr:YcnI family protein [Microbacterium sp. STN6]MCX7523011.1 YcnI family protein [Microbacterium sp. STN6]
MSRSRTRPLAATLTAAVAATALALAAPLAASAHVRVNPDSAEPGGYATLTFKVPTESETASTTALEVDLPTATPFGSVSYQPVPGWTTKIVTTTLDKPVKTSNATITEAPTKVIWTADAASAIAPGQFQQFTISVGPVPDTGNIMLPAHQTYSDGSVVDWDQPTPASGNEPEHPAPTLYITDAPPAEASPAAPTVTSTPVAGSDGSSDSQADAAHSGTSDAVALGLGIGGVALGVIAIVLALTALVRRPAAPAGSEQP